jgi:GDP-4-dehydro-6-deoxy-D-mannose reductase
MATLEGHHPWITVRTRSRQPASLLSVVLVGNLGARRDFLDVRDVVRAYALLARDEFAGQAFNIASGVAVSIDDIVQQLIDMAQCEITVRVDEQRFRPVDVPEIRGDAQKIHEATGWTPHISLGASLRDALEDWRLRVS